MENSDHYTPREEYEDGLRDVNGLLSALHVAD
jgi:hypothetical protein